MTILVTGCAGFIGYHVAKALVRRGEDVIGIDNLNDYYDVALKKKRLHQLDQCERFRFLRTDIGDASCVAQIQSYGPSIRIIVHLAAQAGVRYSVDHPHVYASTNLVGHLNMLELARYLCVDHFVYASSSSVYGANTKLPFSVTDPTDTPLSFYAATKKSNELMSYSYTHLFGLKTTGLRFFTVYGPWGRPDMSAFIFTKAIMQNQAIRVFNHGKMRRNFTYIDDIVDGTVAAMDRVHKKDCQKYALYNLGSDRSEELMDFITTLEDIIGKKAIMTFDAIQPGDVPETIADIEQSRIDLGFTPKTHIRDGLKEFVDWYQHMYP